MQNKNTEQKKSPWYFYFILILIPVLFFLLLEGGLRLFNYGKELPQWVDAARGKYIINPEVAHRYFSKVQTVPTTIEDIFDQSKKKNAFRVFVLGESSAAGFPYMPMGSFSRYIRKRLELVYPNSTIEVVNISLSAINSYTLLDLIPGVLEQDPDLILIYTGHNEYYGALGVGSLESIGNSRAFINLALHLNKYKTTQLLRNTLSWIVSVFASDNNEGLSGTLMSRMAKDQYIGFNSEKFNAGLVQFEENMREILQLAKNKNVPVLLGRLVSNLRDQKPFISIKNSGTKSAFQVFNEAQSELKAGNINKADSLFRLAKDLDALRFRAPEKINSLIEKLGKEFDAAVVPVDSFFNAYSAYGIVGDNLMTDHLHPNIRGYQLMGQAFYETMQRFDYLPGNAKPVIPFSVQDSLTRLKFPFTDLDSTIGNCRILLLKNDWPFISKKQKVNVKYLYKAKNFIDSVAFEFMNNKLTWAEAHSKTATGYLRRGDIKNYLKHFDILIYQYPIVVEYYDEVGLQLISRKHYDEALKYLYGRYKIEPGAFAAKWIGSIALFNKDFNTAIFYLSKSNELNSSDAQVLYNLAGAYSQVKDYASALSTIEKCLNLDANYPQASNLKFQLTQVINNKE